MLVPEKKAIDVLDIILHLDQYLVVNILLALESAPPAELVHSQ
jgi:hypothetical protein